MNDTTKPSYHVSPTGNDADNGTEREPFRTISRASAIARAGDSVIVHEGVYREQVTPAFGGTSNDLRISYETAPDEQVVITGSEPVRGWKQVSGDTWSVKSPNVFFGSFNPYADLINGDWFLPRKREHHTGAVYLNGHWLDEAPSMDAVVSPVANEALWYAKVVDEVTTVWAQFPGMDPNKEDVEINVRKTVFSPDRPGIDFITLRGFTLRNAATPWSPPPAGQIGLVSAYWSKGWIIEENDIRYSKCAGIALGKYSDEWDTGARPPRGLSGRSSGRSQTVGTKRPSAATSSATTASITANKMESSAVSNAHSAGSRATRSMASTSGACSTGSRWRASSSMGRWMSRFRTTTSTEPTAASGSIG